MMICFSSHSVLLVLQRLGQCKEEKSALTAANAQHRLSSKVCIHFCLFYRQSNVVNSVHAITTCYVSIGRGIMVIMTEGRGGKTGSTSEILKEILTTQILLIRSMITYMHAGFQINLTSGTNQDC